MKKYLLVIGLTFAAPAFAETKVQLFDKHMPDCAKDRKALCASQTLVRTIYSCMDKKLSSIKNKKCKKNIVPKIAARKKLGIIK